MPLRTQGLLALLSTAATAVFALTFAPWLRFGLLPLFLAPVLMSAGTGRRRAGLLATAISVPLAAYAFIPPVFSWDIGAEGVLQLVLFAVDGVLVSLLFEGGCSDLSRFE